jgi:hypothetical protein
MSVGGLASPGVFDPWARVEFDATAGEGAAPQELVGRFEIQKMRTATQTNST